MREFSAISALIDYYFLITNLKHPIFFTDHIPLYTSSNKRTIKSRSLPKTIETNQIPELIYLRDKRKKLALLDLQAEV